MKNQQANLVGQTVQRSYRNKGKSLTATLLIIDQVFDATEGGKRKYIVKNTATGEQFRADAQAYDDLYLMKKGPIERFGFKGNNIVPPSHADYRIK